MECIELMIVVAIIGILAAIAIPAYQDYIARSQMSEAMTLASGQKGAVSELFSQTGACPVNGAQGIPTATDIKGQYVTSVTIAGTVTGTGDDAVTNCTITALMNSTNISSGIKGKKVRLAMTNNGGSLGWTCTSDADQKYVPKACTGGATL